MVNKTSDLKSYLDQAGYKDVTDIKEVGNGYWTAKINGKTQRLYYAPAEVEGGKYKWATNPNQAGWTNPNVTSSSADSTMVTNSPVLLGDENAADLALQEFGPSGWDKLMDTLGPMLPLLAATWGAGGPSNLFNQIGTTAGATDPMAQLIAEQTAKYGALPTGITQAEVTSAFDQLSKAVAEGSITKAEAIAAMNEVTNAAGIAAAGGGLAGVGAAADAAKYLPSGGSGNTNKTLTDVFNTLAQLYGAKNAEKITKSILEDTKAANPYSGDAEAQWVRDQFGASSDWLKKAGLMAEDDGGFKNRLSFLDQQAGDFINPYMGASRAGFDRAEQLLQDPTSHPGYGLASTAAGGLETLYTNPMANPIMEAVSRLAAENAARKSTVGRGLNSGSFMAEQQDALMAALGSQFGNIANPMNQSVNAGANWYQGDMKGAGDLGASAANANAAAANAYGSLYNAAAAPYKALTDRAATMAGIGRGMGEVGAAAGGLTTKHLDAYNNALRDRYFTDFNSQATNMLTRPTVTGDGKGGVNIGDSILGAGVNYGLDKLGKLLS